MKDSVASDALVMPSSKRLVQCRLLALRGHALVLVHQNRVLDLLTAQQSACRRRT
jgi:hypothetical protein